MQKKTPFKKAPFKRAPQKKLEVTGTDTPLVLEPINEEQTKIELKEVLLPKFYLLNIQVILR